MIDPTVTRPFLTTPRRPNPQVAPLVQQQPPAPIIVTKTNDEHRHDPLRDGPLRFLGYADELGVSLFGPKSPFFWGSMAISAAYAIADIYKKGKAGANASVIQPRNVRRMDAADKSLEATLFHGISTFALPIFVIDKIKHFAEKPRFRLISKRMENVIVERSPSVLRRLGFHKHLTFPALVALASIPFISKPIDKGTEWLLHKAYLPLRNMLMPKLTPDRVDTVVLDHTTASEILKQQPQQGVQESALFNTLFG